MQHLQMSGVRNQLSARGMALRLDNGKFTVSHKNACRWPAVETFDNLEASYYGGLSMAARRDRLQQVVGA